MSEIRRLPTQLLESGDSQQVGKELFFVAAGAHLEHLAAQICADLPRDTHPIGRASAAQFQGENELISQVFPMVAEVGFEPTFSNV